jgi:hypothetical protein
MAKIYVKAVEPCIFDDREGNVVDMSHTEFYGNARWKGLDPVTGEDISGPRKANPDKIFEVTDSKYWLDLITDKRLIHVEGPEKKPRKAKVEKQEEPDEETIE